MTSHSTNRSIRLPHHQQLTAKLPCTPESKIVDKRSTPTRSTVGLRRRTEVAPSATCRRLHKPPRAVLPYCLIASQRGTPLPRASRRTGETTFDICLYFPPTSTNVLHQQESPDAETIGYKSSRTSRQIRDQSLEEQTTRRAPQSGNATRSSVHQPTDR